MAHKQIKSMTGITITRLVGNKVYYAMPGLTELEYIHPNQYGVLSRFKLEAGKRYNVYQVPIGAFKNGKWIYEWTVVEPVVGAPSARSLALEAGISENELLDRQAQLKLKNSLLEF